jgi:hypothetical protein
MVAAPAPQDENAATTTAAIVADGQAGIRSIRIGRT